MSGFTAKVYNNYTIVNNNYIIYKQRSNDKYIWGELTWRGKKKITPANANTLFI